MNIFSFCFLFISIYLKNNFLIIIISSILISFSFNLNKIILFEIFNKINYYCLINSEDEIIIILISKILFFIILISFVINKIITNDFNNIFIVILFIFLNILIYFLIGKFQNEIIIIINNFDIENEKNKKKENFNQIEIEMNLIKN